MSLGSVERVEDRNDPKMSVRYVGHDHSGMSLDCIPGGHLKGPGQIPPGATAGA